MQFGRAHAAAIGGAHDQRTCIDAGAAEADARRLAGELVHAYKQEAAELYFSDGAQSIDGHTNRCADNRRLGQGCIEDAPLAELLLKALGHAEDAAVGADIFAKQHDARIALQFQGEGLVQRLNHRHLHTRLSPSVFLLIGEAENLFALGLLAR